jgi:hypothetical protein
MKVASFAFSTPNLGDDLQVIAAATFLPRVDTLVDREALHKVELDEPHLVVMNSWFQSAERTLFGLGWRKKRHAPSPSIDPLFYGFCVGRDRMLNGTWTPYLAARQPIGCRDRTSVDKLAALSIAAYWTGCITAFFGRHHAPIPQSERSGIVFIDVAKEAEAAFVPESLRKRATYLTNAVPEGMINDPLARMHHIARTCDALRRAEFVVTSRLHVALPCVSFGTPVVAIVRDGATKLRRFSGFDEFVPVIFHGGKRPPPKIDWDDRTPIRVPDEIESRHAEFIEALKGKLGSVSTEVAPDVAASQRIVIRDHGLGGTSGEVQIDFGRFAVTRPAAVWNADTIEAPIEGFAALKRFRVPLRARSSGADQWREIGALSDYLR